MEPEVVTEKPSSHSGSELAHSDPEPPESEDIAALSPEPVEKSQNSTLRHLNIPLTIEKYSRFHDFRRRAGLQGNEPALTLLLDLAEKNQGGNAESNPANDSLDRLNQVVHRLEALANLFESSKPVRKMMNRIHVPLDHPTPIRPGLTWRKDGNDWLPELGDSRIGA